MTYNSAYEGYIAYIHLSSIASVTSKTTQAQHIVNIKTIRNVVNIANVVKGSPPPKKKEASGTGLEAAPGIPQKTRSFGAFEVLQVQYSARAPVQCFFFQN